MVLIEFQDGFDRHVSQPVGRGLKPWENQDLGLGANQAW
jgi:hypothetical protein